MALQDVAVGDATLAVRTWGDRAGAPFVFWHSLGPGASGALLDVAAPPLLERGLHVVAVDAPGYGRSAPLPRDAYTAERLAELLWAVVDTLGLTRPVLAGHSWGGTIAVTAAAQRPAQARALALLDSGHVDYADWPGANPDATYEELLSEIEAEPLPGTWEALVELLAEHRLDQPWTLAAWREAVDLDERGGLHLRASPSTLAAARHGLVGVRPSAAWPSVSEAGTPTLLLLATEPDDVREANARHAARFAAAIPHAEIRPVEGMRHAVFADLGERAGEIVATWLAEQGATG